MINHSCVLLKCAAIEDLHPYMTEAYQELNIKDAMIEAAIQLDSW